MSAPFSRPAMVITLGLALGVGPIPRALAQAEPTAAELDQARSLFREARHLEDGGKWQEALERFERIARVKMTPQVRFHLALCQENVGKWASALAGYELAAREARGVVREVESEAEDHLRKLAAIVPRVTVSVTGMAAGDKITLDRKPISLDDPALPLGVDPGSHEVEVIRKDAVLAREVFTIEARTTRTIMLRVERPEPSPKPPEPLLAPPAPSPLATAPTIPPIPSALVPPSPRGNGSPATAPVRIAAWSMIGVGAASGVATGIFLVLRQSALRDLDAACPTHVHCPASVEPIVMQGTLDAAMVNVFGVLTGVATGGGIALLLSSPSAPAPRAPSAQRATIHVAPALAGLTQGGLTGIVAGGRF